MLDLRGKTTPGGWRLVDQVAFAPDHTGGHFSDCYFVEKDGKRAFLKALDIEKFDISVLGTLLAGFQYESELLELCRERKLGRIVQVIESDRIERDPAAPAVLRYVPFLVFELAEGDIRATVDASQSVSNQWRFFVLHQTTLALLQLHQHSIAHQDAKPSNVLLFGNNKLKLGDLGRSSLRGKSAPHDVWSIAGARNYAPFEQRYDHVPGDWIERRLSTDVFHLGCLVVFAFTNICFAEFVMSRLAAPYQVGNWGASYPEVMPHIQAAMAEALKDLAADFPERFRPELVSIVHDLCHPDPALRGRSGAGTRRDVGLLWLQRYVSRFDILEKAARVRQPVTHA
jgi:serine/threonine protein kinase